MRQPGADRQSHTGARSKNSPASREDKPGKQQHIKQERRAHILTTRMPGKCFPEIGTQFPCLLWCETSGAYSASTFSKK